MAAPPLKHLLLDMDGVLAEVSASYRTAIVETCKHFIGPTCNVDANVIKKEKERGGCNNDWILSHTLIQRGLADDAPLPSLTEVTAKFEELYQGTATTPGLCELETLIPPPSLFATLHEKTNGSLGIVTGRPRSDCDAFLTRFDLEKFFAVKVCMEDCVVTEGGSEVKRFKPDRYPCRLACERLGIPEGERGVTAIVGDTPDDVVSGREAGIRSIGVLVPGDDGVNSAIKGRLVEEGGGLCGQY